MRCASYSRGLTSRRSRNPKFFSARTTCAMLTRSWGSWRTVTTVIARACLRPLVRNDAVGCRLSATSRTGPNADGRRLTADGASSNKLQDTHPLRLLPISPQPHPSVPAAPDELPRPSHSAGEHLVNDKVEADPAADVRAVPIGPGDRQRDAVAALRASPGALDPVGQSRRLTGSADSHATPVLPFGHDQEAGGVVAFQIAQVQRQHVRVNIVR